MPEVNPTFITILIAFGVLLAAKSIRIAAESERFANFVAGRFVGLKGPGLIFQLIGSGTDSHRIKMGDTGQMIGPTMVRLAACDVPAIVSDRLRLGAKVAVVGFEDAAVVVDLDPEAAMKVSCPQCNHEFLV